MFTIAACSVEPITRLRWHSSAIAHARFCGRQSVVTSSTDGTIACWNLSSQRQPTDLSPDGSPSCPVLGGAPCRSAGNGGSTTSNLSQPASVHGGHSHSHNFVGLSVRPAPDSDRQVRSSGRYLIATGSEDGQAVVYSEGQTQRLVSWQLHNGGDSYNSEGSFMGASELDGGDRRRHGTSALRPIDNVCHEGLSRHSHNTCEFLSAVAWASPSCCASEAPLLAVASSDGSASVLQLQQ
jgi:WD40 repeat protein